MATIWLYAGSARFYIVRILKYSDLIYVRKSYAQQIYPFFLLDAINTPIPFCHCKHLPHSQADQCSDFGSVPEYRPDLSKQTILTKCHPVRPIRPIVTYDFFSDVLFPLSRFLVPCIQLSNTFLPCLRSLVICAVNVFISPFCMSLALCCTQISISLSNKDLDRKRDKDTVWM